MTTTTLESLRDQVNATVDYLEAFEESADELWNEADDVTLINWLYDSVLYTENMSSADRKYRGAIILLTYGGPHIELDTR